MTPKVAYALLYAPNFGEQLKTIEVKYYSLIRREIESQLTYEPDVETRNRKPLKRPNIYSEAWEIRFGPENQFRVFYRVLRERHQVFLLAIGQKRGSRLFIGREEFDL